MEQLSQIKTMNKKTGFALVEVLISIGIIAVLIAAFNTFIVKAAKLTQINQNEFQANLYLKEVIEIVEDLEQSDWEELSLSCTESNPCHPASEGSVWKLYSYEQTLNGKYKRGVYIESVCRDDSDFPNNIVPCPGSFNDFNTKKVVATITWNNGSTPRTLVLETYVYNNPY